VLWTLFIFLQDQDLKLVHVNKTMLFWLQYQTTHLYSLGPEVVQSTWVGSQPPDHYIPECAGYVLQQGLQLPTLESFRELLLFDSHL
jgi:hypothetical protein